MLTQSIVILNISGKKHDKPMETITVVKSPPIMDYQYNRHQLMGKTELEETPATSSPAETRGSPINPSTSRPQ